MTECMVCQHENEEGSEYCEECGVKLTSSQGPEDSASPEKAESGQDDESEAQPDEAAAEEEQEDKDPEDSQSQIDTPQSGIEIVEGEGTPCPGCNAQVDAGGATRTAQV